MKNMSIIITVIVLIFGSGGAWMTVKGQTDENRKDIESIEEDVEQIDEDQREFELSLQRFEMQQTALQEDMNEVQQTSKSIYELLLDMKKG